MAMFGELVLIDAESMIEGISLSRCCWKSMMNSFGMSQLCPAYSLDSRSRRSSSSLLPTGPEASGPAVLLIQFFGTQSAAFKRIDKAMMIRYFI